MLQKFLTNFFLPTRNHFSLKSASFVNNFFVCLFVVQNLKKKVKEEAEEWRREEKKERNVNRNIVCVDRCAK